MEDKCMKKHHGTRLLTAAISLVLICMLAVSACADASNVNPAGEFPICKEPITITVGLPQNTNVEDFETNAQTLWYEEMGNFNLEFEYFPSNTTDARQKLAVMIAAGSELPDVLIGFELSEETVLYFGQEGVFLPLDELMDEYGYYIDEILDKADNKEIIEWMKSADGNTYYLGKANEQIGNMYSLRSWINQTWLDNLGLEIPTTTDEFYEVLKAFVTQDPNGNGIADEIGMIGGTGWRENTHDWLMNAFIYNDTDCRWLVQDGTLDVAFNKPEWREGLRYVNKLIGEGLLLPQSFTMDNAQMKQLIEADDTLATVGVITGGTMANFISATNELKYEYVPLGPLTGPEGVCYATYFPVIPIKNFIITSDADNVEAAFRWGDLMFSEEGYMHTRWGVPEEDWTYPPESATSLLTDLGIEPSVVPILPWGSVQNSHWNFITAGIVPYGVSDGQVMTADPLNADIWIAKAIPLYIGKEAAEHADILKYTSEEAEEINELKLNIYTYVKECMARFSTGDMSLDTEWNSYCTEFENLGLDRFIELSQNAYDRANE
jgi:putative aldouronate transport system substrate-binding protein